MEKVQDSVCGQIAQKSDKNGGQQAGIRAFSGVIAFAHIQPGEETELLAIRQNLLYAERISTALNAGKDAINGENGAGDIRSLPAIAAAAQTVFPHPTSPIRIRRIAGIRSAFLPNPVMSE